MNLRRIAYRILTGTLKGGMPKRLIEEAFHRYGLSHHQRAFVAEMVYGTLRWLLKLDWIIDRFLEKPEKLDRRVRNVLRLGIYQMDFMGSVPEYAAINESVELVKWIFRREPYLAKPMARLTNAVLRRYQRERSRLRFPILDEDPIGHISITQSHPRWLVRRWVERWGTKWTLKLCEANNLLPPITLRANALRCSRDQLLEELKGEGLEVSSGRYAPEAVKIEGYPVFERLESFKKGLFFLQDEASMLVVHALSPQVGEFVIDVCAAPGGKTTHIAEMTGNLATVVALDVSGKKLKLIRENCARLGITGVRVRKYDASEPAEDLIGRADRVLVDVPCSNTGVIRRHPDLKWKRSEEDVEKLADLQFRILLASAQYVKRGGVLLYSTCSLEEEENEGVIERFLGEVKGFETESVADYLPTSAKELVTDKGFMRSFPHIHGLDGFFAARLRRR
ncbi:TPA: 16S rRNA (cytosine(967)-C(5))-methyltransferase RsmB [Candidatus Poribacteria bacterium]|nr:16S rRNA (cytosine(967)-C(5))-methyltransferase RsmB [Candidatus Poribacteria bacterium]